MKPAIIDWRTTESKFVEDETYESFNAPKWVDLSSPNELVDDEAWFCNPDCKHPKSAEDFKISARSSLKMGKLLRSLSVSEIFPFSGKSRRDAKLNGVEIKPHSAAKLHSMKTKGSSSYVCIANEESENKNPNVTAPLIGYCKSKTSKASVTPCGQKKKKGDQFSSQYLSKHSVKPQLRSTFSASNLLKGREVLNHITEFCTDMKNLAKRGSRKKISENCGSKEKVRERMPLIVREG